MVILRVPNRDEAYVLNRHNWVGARFRTKTEREKESESKIRERSVENVIGNDLRGQRSAERGYRTGEECL